jgi:hypothetical protein
MGVVRKGVFMKAILTVAMFLSFSAFAGDSLKEQDSYFSGSSDFVSKNQLEDFGSYLTTSSDILHLDRDLASSDKKKFELPMGDSSYFTGSSF